MPLGLSDYSGRALFDDSKSLAGRRVVLTGFVSRRNPDDPSAGWYLTRMALSCCAADAFPVKVEVLGGEQYPVDAWVSVTGTWVPGQVGTEQKPLAIVSADSIAAVAAPAEPCE